MKRILTTLCVLVLLLSLLRYTRLDVHSLLGLLEGIIPAALLPEAEMRKFIGPPLEPAFMEFLGVDRETALKAVQVYRAEYKITGILGVEVYDGIPDMLDALVQAGHTLHIATSKPEGLANEVLNHFDLARYFEQIAGATLDGSRSHKADVITYLLGLTGDVGQTLMVGDTAFDVIGAAAHGIPTIGVSWGYGKVEEMQEAGAVAIAESMDALLSLLIS